MVQVEPQVKRRVLIGAAIAVVALGIAAVVLPSFGADEPVFCTMEGQIQEDGSIWGRDPNNNCEFAPMDSLGR